MEFDRAWLLIFLVPGTILSERVHNNRFNSAIRKKLKAGTAPLGHLDVQAS